MDVIIRNFQSIIEAKLRLEGFTILIGESSAGKSSCLKALYAATHNRFKIGQVRNGEDYTEVKVRFPEDERTLVVRRHPTGSPDISLGDQRFAKLARTVPPQVEEFCNFGYLEVSDDKYSLNFRSQFDKPLLIEYSQKKVMEILSASKAIDDLNKVHYALSKKREQNRGAFKHVDAVITEQNANLSMIKFEIETTSITAKKLRETLDKYLADTNASDECCVLETFLADEEKLRLEALTRHTLQNFCQSAITESKTFEKVKDCIENLDSHTRCLYRMDALNRLVRLLSNTKFEQLQKANDLQELLDQDNALTEEKNIVTKNVSKYQKIVDLQSQVKKRKAELADVYVVLANLATKSLYDVKESELKDIVLNNKCPICGNDMSNHEHKN